MKKCSLILALLPALVSCEQPVRSTPLLSEPETINSVRNYSYPVAQGQRLLIHNSGPKGDSYTAPDGTVFFKVNFWTRIINETDRSVKVTIDFRSDSFEISGLPGSYYRILVPPDTMTPEKESQYNYGLTDLKLFLDQHLQKHTSLERMIKPKEATGFYVVMLRLMTEAPSAGILRTGLVLKGNKLFYRIARYSSKRGLPLLNQQEIPCGGIAFESSR